MFELVNLRTTYNKLSYYQIALMLAAAIPYNILMNCNARFMTQMNGIF